MPRHLLGSIALATLLCATTTANAATVFKTVLLGSNEVPANASPATGAATVTILGDLMTVDVTWDGLIGGLPGAAHIHCCANPGTNVGVAVGFPSFPAALSGSYNHVFNLLDPTTYTAGFLNNFGGGTAAGAEAALLAGFEAGRSYVNIHNATFPGGEIRGFLSPVPEPGAWGLMILGFGLAGAAVRRRRALAA